MKLNIGKIVTQFSHGIDFWIGHILSRQFSLGCEEANIETQWISSTVFVALNILFSFVLLFSPMHKKVTKSACFASGVIGDAIQNECTDTVLN